MEVTSKAPIQDKPLVPTENLKKLHDNLSKRDGFSVPYDQFESDMQDENNLKRLHDNLAKQQDFTVPYDQFKTDMFSDQPEATDSQPQSKQDQTRLDNLSEQPLTYMQKELRQKFPENYTEEPVVVKNAPTVKPLGKVDQLKVDYLRKTRGEEFANQEQTKMQTPNPVIPGWDVKSPLDKFTTGVKSGWEGTKGGLKYTGAVMLEGIDKMDGEDDLQYDNRLFESAKENFKAAPRGEGIWYQLGSFTPQMIGIAAAAASAPITGGTSLSAAPAIIGGTNIATLVASASGSAMHEYDQYNEQEGKEGSDLARIGVGIGSGAAEYLAERIGLDRYMPKGSMSKAFTKFLSTSGKDVAEEIGKNAVSKNPSLKGFLKKTATNMLEEGSEESLTEAGNILIETLYKDDKDEAGLGEVVTRLKDAFGGGALMGGVLSPITYGADAAYQSKMQQPITTATIEGQQFTINNPEDLGVEGKPIFTKDAEGNIKPVPNHKVTDFVTQTQGEIDQAQQQAADQQALMNGIADPNAQILTDETYDEGARVVDFSNGQTKIIYNGQEVVANDVNEKDNILNSITDFQKLPQPKINEVGEVIEPAPERKVITQKIGTTDIDIIEGEEFDEVVPSEKVPLEKSLVALEKKFKDNKKFKLEVDKVQVEEPGETKYDDPVKKTVIKSIKIVPVTQNVNNSEVNAENVTNAFDQLFDNQLPTVNNESENQQINELQNEDSEKTIQPTAGIVAEEGENTPQEDQGERVQEGLEENVKVINGYKFSKSPTLSEKDGIVVEPLSQVDSDLVSNAIYIEGSPNILYEGARNEGGGWFSIRHENGKILHNYSKGIAVFLDHKKGGRLGVIVQDFIKNNSADQPSVETVKNPLPQTAVLANIISTDQPVVESLTADPVAEQMDGFDWNGLNAAIEDAYANKLTGRELIDQQREENYQASKFSKKWAKTHKEAVQKTVDEYNQAKEQRDLWQAKEYKSAKGKNVEVGGELEGGTYSVDYINKKRKADHIKNAEITMKEALSDLKELGLTKDEISVIENNVDTSTNNMDSSVKNVDTFIPELTEQQKIDKHNNIVSLMERYNKARSNAVNIKSNITKEINQEIQKLGGGYVLAENKGKLEVQKNSKKIQRIGIKQTTEQKESHKALSDYPEEVQAFIQRFLDNPAELIGLDVAGDNELAEQGRKNIIQGKKTVQHNNVLDSLEDMFKRGVIVLRSTNSHEAHEIPIDEYLSAINEQLAEIDVENVLDSSSQIDEWMNDEVQKDELEPEQLEELENDLENYNNGQEEIINPEDEVGVGAQSGSNESPKPIEEEISSQAKAGIVQQSLFPVAEFPIDKLTKEEKRIKEKLDSLTPTQLKEAKKGIESIDKQINEKLSAIKASKKTIKDARKQARDEYAKDNSGKLITDNVVNSMPLIRRHTNQQGLLQREYLKLIADKEKLIDNIISGAKAQNEINWDAPVIPEEKPAVESKIKVGDIVKYTEPAIVYVKGVPTTVQANRAGTVKVIKTNGDLELRTQNGDIITIKQSDVVIPEAEVKEPWQMTKKEFVTEKELSENSFSNLSKEQRPNTYKEGDYLIDSGSDPYVYQFRMIDPNSIDYTEKHESEESVLKRDDTQKFIQWFKQGILPQPITVVNNQTTGTLKSTNRRRLLAARAAGVKSIPAFVEIGKHKEIIQKALSEGKPVPQEVLNDYPELSKLPLNQVLEDAVKAREEKKQDEKLINRFVPTIANEKKMEDSIGLPVYGRDKKSNSAQINVGKNITDTEDSEGFFTFVSEIILAGNKIDPTKPFFIAYFGDNTGNKYERAVISQSSKEVLETVKNWDQQEVMMQTINPESGLRQSFVAYPIANEYDEKDLIAATEKQSTPKLKIVADAETIISGSPSRRLADLSDLISKTNNIEDLKELLNVPFIKSNMDLPKEIYLKINYLERHPEKQSTPLPEEEKKAEPRKPLNDFLAEAKANNVRFKVTPDQARKLTYKTELPSSEIFNQAVKNTPDSKITEDGLIIKVIRFQTPDQENELSVRTGVFYLPSGDPNIKHYKTGKNGYGGTVKQEGETLIKKPIFVKGATGGKAPENAYDQIKGKGAYQAMRTEVLRATTGYNKRTYADDVYNILDQYGADPDLAWHIVDNSKGGNTLPYAVQENIVAHAVREAGYDAVIGYSTKRDGTPFISEIFDVREITYPSNEIESDIHDSFISEQNDVRLRIIGEKGAASIDREEEVTTRLDNLAIAREMETSGKDAKTISLATGWEKGADGKWRYEVPDDIKPKRYVDKAKFAQAKAAYEKIRELNEAKDYDTDRERLIKTLEDFYKTTGVPYYTGDQTIHNALRTALLEDNPDLLPEPAISHNIEFWQKKRVDGEALLEDVIDNERMYNEYPFLRYVGISFKNIDSKGSYSPGSETIVISDKLKGYDEEVKSTMLHEIQHAIQYFEGFAKGGNLQSGVAELYDRINKQLNDIAREMNNLMVPGNWGKFSDPKGYELKDKYDALMQEKMNANPYDHYKRLAGEVESRNVQSRINMTPEERRNTLLQETEDVAREDQIVLMGGLGASNLQESIESENINVSSLASSDLSNRPNVVKALTKISDELGEPVQIINSSEIPTQVSELKKQITSGNRVPAFFYNGQIYLLSDQVTSVSDALKSYLHELIVHKGLREVFAGADKTSIIGKQYTKFNDLMVDVFGSMSRSQKIDIASKYVPGLYNQNGKIMRNPTIEEKALIGEEFLAHISENQDIYDEPTLTKWQQFINRLLQIIRKAFRLTSNQFSQSDLLDIVRESRERLKNKAKGETEAETRLRVTDENKSTINIDGVERPTLNSNGKPIANSEEGIRNFWKWFGDSKVVDSEGRPLVVYHYSHVTNITEFNPFRGDNNKLFSEQQKKDKLEEVKTKFENGERSTWRAGMGIYFSPNKGEYKSYGEVEYSAYLRITNPTVSTVGRVGKIFDSKPMIEGKKTDGFFDYAQGELKEISVQLPSQIKSTGNNGNFSPESNDIRFQIVKDDALNQLKEDLDKITTLQKSTVRLNELEDSKSGKTKVEKQTIINQISKYKEGYRAGASEKRLTLYVIQRNIIKYASDNMNYDQATKGEINQLLTAIKNANTPATISKAFDRIDEIVTKMNTNQERNSLNKDIEALIRQATSPKRTGTMTMGKFNIDDVRQFAIMKKYNDEAIRLSTILRSNVASVSDKNAAGKELDRIWDELNAIEDKTIIDEVTLKIIDWRRSGSRVSIQLLTAIRDDLELLYKQAKEAKTEEDIKIAIVRKNEREFISKFIRDKKYDMSGLAKRFNISLNNFTANVMGNWETVMTMLGGVKLREKTSLIMPQVHQEMGVHNTFNEVLTKAYKAYKFKSKQELLLHIQDLSKKDFELIQPNFRGGKVEGAPDKISMMQIMDIYNAIKNHSIERDWYLSYGDVVLDSSGKNDLDIQLSTGRARINDLIGKLSEGDKKFADMMMDKLSEYSPQTNEVFVKMFNMDRKSIEVYWPSSALLETDVDVMEQFFEEGKIPSFFKDRAAHRTPVPKDAFGKFTQHVKESEWIVNMALPLNELNKTFRNSSVKKLIEQNRGNKYYGTIKQHLQKVGLRPTTKDLTDFERIGGSILSNWVVAKIGLSVSVPIKQLIGAVNYAENMPAEQWLLGFAKAVADPKGTFDEVWENCPYLQVRFNNGYSEALQYVMNATSNLPKASNWHQAIKNIGTIGTRGGDIVTLIYGGKPYIDYLIKNGMSKKDAYDKFIIETLRAQQSGLTSTLSIYQNSNNPFARALFTFSNTPSQYMRKMFEANQAFRHGDINAKQLTKVYSIYAVANSILYVGAGMLISAMLTGDDPEDEWEKMAIQGILSFVGGLPLINDLAESATRQALGLKVYDDALPVLVELNDIRSKLIKTMQSGDGLDQQAEADKKKVYFKDAIISIFELGGISAGNAERMYNATINRDNKAKERKAEDAREIISKANKYHKFLIESIKREDNELHSKLMSDKTALSAVSQLVISDAESGRKSYDSRITNLKKYIKYWKNIKTDEGKKKVDEYELLLDNTYNEILEKYSDVEFPSSYKLKE